MYSWQAHYCAVPEFLRRYPPQVVAIHEEAAALGGNVTTHQANGSRTVDIVAQLHAECRLIGMQIENCARVDPYTPFPPKIQVRIAEFPYQLIELNDGTAGTPMQTRDTCKLIRGCVRIVFSRTG